MNKSRKIFIVLTGISIIIHLVGIFQKAIGLFEIPSHSFGISFVLIGILLPGFLYIGIGLIGILKFLNTKTYYNKWLKAYGMLSTLYFILYLPSRITLISGQHPVLKHLNFSNLEWPFYMAFIFALIYFIFTIKHFSKEEQRFLSTPSIKKIPRIIHYIIDGVFIVYASNNFNSALEDLLGNTIYFSQNRTLIILAIISFTALVYYIVSETVFKQTLGKLLTNHYVAKSDGSKANFGNIFIRTICRFIPFEAFSYLPSPMSKWHDKFSGTDVFEDIQTVTDTDYTNDIPNTSFEEESFDPGRWEE